MITTPTPSMIPPRNDARLKLEVDEGECVAVVNGGTTDEAAALVVPLPLAVVTDVGNIIVELTVVAPVVNVVVLVMWGSTVVTMVRLWSGTVVVLTNMAVVVPGSGSVMLVNGKGVVVMAVVVKIVVVLLYGAVLADGETVASSAALCAETTQDQQPI
jgi:hypothetical protein